MVKRKNEDKTEATANATRFNTISKKKTDQK